MAQIGQLHPRRRRHPHRHHPHPVAQRQSTIRPDRAVFERKGPGPARLRRPGRDRRCLEADLEGQHRLSLGQARRPVLPDTDLRQPGRGRGRLHANLVALNRRRRRRARRGAAASLGYARQEGSNGTARPRITGVRVVRCGDDGKTGVEMTRLTNDQVRRCADAGQAPRWSTDS